MQFSPLLLFYVAAGGAFGALCRYAAITGVNSWMGRDFPYGTMVVNILGSFLMGLLLGVIASMLPRGRELYLLAGVGALGGFTTFSAFAFDSFLLIEKGLLIQAFIYMAGSVLLALIAFMFGMWVFRTVAGW